MKLLRNINILKILKILCMILCMVFLLSACADNPGGKMGPSDDKQETIENQRDCYIDVSSNKMVCPDTDSGMQSQRDCIQASLLEMMYGGLGEMANNIYEKLTAEDLMSLLAMAFSLWMAFQILGHVAATTPESLSEFWTKILRKAAICVACGILASSTENIYYAINTFVLPIYITLLEFASTILELLGSEPGADTTQIVIEGNIADDISDSGSLVEPIKHKMSDAACLLKDTAGIKMESGKFPQEPVQLMGCMACAISDRLNIGYTISMLMMSSGNILSFLVAIFLFCAFTFVKWGFALYLVDSIFRFTMMITIMPFLILFYPFEQTRKWTTVGFQTILNSASIMLCLAALIGATVYAMEQLLNNPAIGDFGDKQTFENFGTTPLAMMFMGIVILKVSGLAVSLSNQVTGGGGEARFQKKVAALIGFIAEGLLLILSWGSSSTISAVAAYSRRVRMILEKVEKAKAKVNEIKQKMNQMAGRNNNNGGQ